MRRCTMRRNSVTIEDFVRFQNNICLTRYLDYGTLGLRCVILKPEIEPVDKALEALLLSPFLVRIGKTGSRLRQRSAFALFVD